LNVREQAAVVETGKQSLNEALFELGQHGWILFPNGAPQRQQPGQRAARKEVDSRISTHDSRFIERV